MRIASFDIGKKNFSQYAQDTDLDLIIKLQNKYKSLPKNKQRRVKGDMNSDIEDILKQIYLAGTQIHMGVYDFRLHKDSDKLDMPTRKNLLIHLNRYRRLWKTCDVIVIEQQYYRTFNPKKKGRNKGTEANVDAIKIGEATLMWFLDKYPQKEIMYFGSQFKTQILGAPWGLTKSQRKNWAIEKTREIANLRNDTEMIEIFNLKDRIFRKRLTKEDKIQEFIDSYPGTKKYTKKLAVRMVRERQKLDDVSDSCVQAQAFIFKYLVAEF